MKKRWDRFLERWDRFFFEEVSPASLGIFRIALGLLLLVWELLLWPDLLLWFGPKGFLRPVTLERMADPVTFSVFKFLPATDGAVLAVFGVLFAATLLFTVGLFTRTVSVIVFLCLLSFLAKNPLLVYGPDSVLQIMMFLMIFTRAGAAYSLDQRLSRKVAPLTIPAWGQRLLQLQLSLIYVSAAVWKSLDVFWRDGTAVCWILQMPDIYHFPLGPLRTSEAFCHAATWGTLVAELAFGTLIWVRILRPYVIAAAVAFHLSLDYALAIPLFQWAMLVPLVTFGPWIAWPEALRFRVRLAADRPAG